ncbi:MAG: DNA sulfur modification protein DndB [Cyanomargarita calcarea GSE-NOS-MK-12-04C]|jgi:DNA sulfur modification protein DndB|uniref:DNA sulfur modification protein DndB n=1 Tax=Cyanomargarita calcarea GSE-NOS-MK-12-04C TaxID=2839659 RepID=A0A951UV15_9CYAN|nr:DNA sulfur modification protein DndB [Cyanomargarita calcarea GSE-NOS-MK-12-04C]
MAQINEDAANTVPSETKSQFNTFLEPFFSQYHRERCYPGLIFQQGKRVMLQINVPASDFSGLLQAKPSTGNDPDSGKNRPEVKGHAEEIKEYIVDRVRKGKPWIVGTLTANVASKDIKILEFGRGICLVVIPRGIKLDITDGQHRKSAIHKLIESAESNLISDDDFPITLVLEGDFQQCQADFRDMAQTRQLDKSLLVSFGEFSGRVGITKELIKRVPMFQGKTEKIKLTPASKQKLIYTTNYIARFVSCVFTNDPSNQLRDYDVYETSDALVISLNQFFSECNNTEYVFDTEAEELTVDEVTDFKEDCLLGVSVGLEILGRLLYFIYIQGDNSFNEERITELAQLDWSRQNPLWKDNVVRIDPKPKNPDKPYKLSTGTTAAVDAVKMVQIKLGWM